MERYGLTHDSQGQQRLDCPYRGTDLLRHPMYNKSTAFTAEERRQFGLAGLLPPQVMTMEQQAQRIYQNILRKSDPLERYIGLAALQDRNECLFFHLLVQHIKEFLPIVYTPTVGRACQEWSHIFRRARGLWITRDTAAASMRCWATRRMTTCGSSWSPTTSASSAWAIRGPAAWGFRSASSPCTTAAAGIPPWQTLPISLDVGTDNQQLLNDDLYLGWRERRLRGPEYDSLVEEFVQAVKRRFPKALLQWEDFKKNNAFRLLARYRKTLTCFNDDIQGTAAVAVAGIVAGTRVTGIPLTEQRIVLLGAGAAGVGIAALLRSTLRAAGLSGEALSFATANLDSKGLLVDDQAIDDEHKREFAWSRALAERHGLGTGRPRDLLAVVRAIKPTVLVGTSGEPGAFTEEVVREMAQHVERPVILPMSNPTSSSEATAADVIRWTAGRALCATGSPFDPVEHDGRQIVIGQGNNAYIFPGIGLGVIVSEAREVTDSMFAVAADRLAREVSLSDLASGSLYPPIEHLRSVTEKIAHAVAREARESRARRPRPVRCRAPAGHRRGDVGAALSAAASGGSVDRPGPLARRASSGSAPRALRQRGAQSHAATARRDGVTAPSPLPA